MSVVLDIQDDHGLLLAAAADVVPETIKTAAAPDGEALASLPDDLFALVIDRPGKEPLRKFACTDGPTTWVSAFYLCQTYGDLPSTVVKTAARCLRQAADVYGVELPPRISSLAEHGGLESLNMERPEIKLAEGTKTAGGLDSMLDAIRTRRQECKFRKQGDLTGTELMPVGQTRAPTKKLASFDNHVALSGPKVRDLLPQVRVVMDQFMPKTASGTAYPTEKMRDINELEQAFQHSLHKIAAEDRVSVATALAEREAELGVPTSAAVAKYAGLHFRPQSELSVALLRRNNMAKRAGKDPALYNTVSGDTPHQFAEKLAAVDRALGLDREWDRGLEDPWGSVLASTKEAELIYNKHNILLSDHQLERMASTETKKTIGTILDEDMVEEFIKDPVGVFRSLPDPVKRSIAMLADDPVWRGSAT